MYHIAKSKKLGTSPCFIIISYNQHSALEKHIVHVEANHVHVSGRLNPPVLCRNGLDHVKKLSEWLYEFHF